MSICIGYCRSLLLSLSLLSLSLLSVLHNSPEVGSSPVSCSLSVFVFVFAFVVGSTISSPAVCAFVDVVAVGGGVGVGLPSVSTPKTAAVGASGSEGFGVKLKTWRT